MVKFTEYRRASGRYSVNAMDGALNRTAEDHSLLSRRPLSAYPVTMIIRLCLAGDHDHVRFAANMAHAAKQR
jgi:hypothetical protein